MNHETAKAALDHYQQALKELMSMLDTLKKGCPADEYLKYRLTVAQLIGASMDLSNPIHLEHPDLDVHGVTTALRALPPTRVEPPVANTPEEKLELLCALAEDHIAIERKRDSPNEDLYRQCFKELAGAGVVAERMSRETKDAATASAGLVLEGLIRVAFTVVALSDRDPAGEQTKH